MHNERQRRILFGEECKAVEYIHTSKDARVRTKTAPQRVLTAYSLWTLVIHNKGTCIHHLVTEMYIPFSTRNLAEGPSGTFDTL